MIIFENSLKQIHSNNVVAFVFVGFNCVFTMFSNGHSDKLAQPTQ